MIEFQVPLNNTKAVLFDKDGTLCLSGSYLTALAIARADFCKRLSGINNLQAPYSLPMASATKVLIQLGLQQLPAAKTI
ncbi:hypothetical protein AAF134_09880 [Synechococcus lacustris Tous-12m]